MASNLSPEETAAILPEGEERVARVATRDFRQPRRLSREARELLRRRAGLGLRQAETSLRAWLRSAISIELVDAGEVSAQGLLDGLEEPFFALSLASEHGGGWVVWDNPCACAVVDVAFGSKSDSDTFTPSSDREPRLLTPVESGIAVDLVRELAAAIGEALGTPLEPAELHQSLRELRTASVTTPGEDPQRVFLHIGLAAPGIEGTLRVYLPGALAGGGPAASHPEAPPALPAHLDPVPVELSATLGSIDVPLAELLTLEVGDVVPLGLAHDSPAHFHVEDHVCGRAEWGAHQGRLALRIRELESIDEDE